MTVDSARTVDFDPIALQVLWTRLIALADESAVTLVRTSFSPVVRESNDFACALFDADGNHLAENSIGIPSFNVTMANTLAAALKKRSITEWHPGDVMITNDPWLASGHLPDITMMTPIFAGGDLVAWTGSVAHMADIGGAGWTPDTREIYEEGLRIPLSLLFEDGVPNDDLFEIIKANVRMPDEVVGDLMAMVAAGRGAAAGVGRLMREAELVDLVDLSWEVRRRGEEAMRRAVASIPDGTYRSEAELDGTGEEAIKIVAAVTISGSDLLVDYNGTSPQVNIGLNTVLGYTTAYTCYPIKCALDPRTPRNGGTYQCITVKAPEGSILNPTFPAPVNARQLVGHALSGVLFEALSGIVPDKVIAESGSAPSLRVVLSGKRSSGDRFNDIFFVSGGLGARPDSDGLGAMCFPSTISCGAMEVLEADTPIRVWRKELTPDSGGAGRNRGGVGQDLEIEVLGSEQCKLALFVDRVNHPARGLHGGAPGGTSRVELNGSTHGFPLKGRTIVNPGDRIKVRYPGGGGYGDPRERPRGEVHADVRQGLVSETKAKELYEL